MKRVITVGGLIDPSEIGITMMHEHIFIDLMYAFVQPGETSFQHLVDAPVSMELLSLLRRRPYSITRDNVVLSDERTAIEELSAYYREGGKTIVDCTSIGLGRDPAALYRVSRATNLHIVMGSGCYTEPSHPAWVRGKSVAELADRFIDEIIVGVDGTGIRCGIIGEVGIGGVPRGSRERIAEVTDEEVKVLRAAGRAARETGVAVSIHLDSRGRGAPQVIDLLENEGLASDRIVMGHMDLVEDLDYHRAALGRGVYVQYDSLGREYYSEELGGLSWGHDSWRIRFLLTLIAEGYAHRLVLSQDVGFKFDLLTYGGNGYCHVLRWIVPSLRRKGVPEEAIFAMLVDNPRRILSVDVAQ